MDDQILLSQFEAGSLPGEAWNHRAHVRLAFLYLREFSFEEALGKLRIGIQALNAAHNVPEGPLSGYNETTTHAFLHLVRATIAAYGEICPAADSVAFYNAHPQLHSRHALRLFYSPGRRGHPAAKVRFIEPDLAPLPRIVGRQGDPST